MTIAFVVGIIVAVLVGMSTKWTYAVVAGWAAACVIYIVWVWAVVWGYDPASTKAHALREDPGRGLSDVLLLVASVASVVAIVFILVQAHLLHGFERGVLALLAVLSVSLSWILIHTLFMLRYAQLYFVDDSRPIDFNQKATPQYSDFAYLSFTLGMTFQVSDTNVSDVRIRKTILRHSLLSYVFGTVILATTVNLVAGLTA
ncbi:DUF1345 domain-containing protein [Diaminobutyricibacter tongyongensis]|uniref:DUF1345 domain-containing protein n=2 Tax=Leifsonia tongyongensis TaxID=1268043 RepID=A0A6L9XYX2_9MICO|nr:DUF1345 domain-containing protein [Diaminobutyricibacter tongyongensis]NEN06407.1 DUF1345 domain-containing protein [Diaminobutyricibacter tongyongensis]